MKKSIFFTVVILILSLTSANIFAQKLDDILGYWYMPEDEKGRIPVANIFEKNGKLYAYAFAYQNLSDETDKDVNNPNQKLRNRYMSEVVFIYDLNVKGSNLIGGEIYNPSTGKYYYLKGKLIDNGNSIKWKASIDAAGVFGPTIIWNRVKNPSRYKNLEPDFNTIQKNIPTVRQKNKYYIFKSIA